MMNQTKQASFFIPKWTSLREVVSLNAPDAQEYCNFIIFIPTYVPKDLNLVQQTLRKENNSEIRSEVRSTYRLKYEGIERSIVVKQFLYDWAPPAYDYPCLWRNNKMATSQEVQPPKGIFVGNNVLWIGKNYRNQNAATIEIDRTRIELTLEKGTFTVDELSEFCAHLKPVNPEIRHQILNTPFGYLSYCARHKDNVVKVPTSYWKHQRHEMMSCFLIDKNEEQEVILLYCLSKFEKTLKTMGYSLNSILGFGEKKDVVAEVEFVFEHLESKSSIRILASLGHSQNPIQFPPEIGDQICLLKQLNHTNQKDSIYYACSSTFDCGSHELVFKRDNINYMMLIKPAPWTSNDWLMQLIEKL